MTPIRFDAAIENPFSCDCGRVVPVGGALALEPVTGTMGVHRVHCLPCALRERGIEVEEVAGPPMTQIVTPHAVAQGTLLVFRAPAGAPPEDMLTMKARASAMAEEMSERHHTTVTSVVVPHGWALDAQSVTGTREKTLPRLENCSMPNRVWG